MDCRIRIWFNEPVWPFGSRQRSSSCRGCSLVRWISSNEYGNRKFEWGFQIAVLFSGHTPEIIGRYLIEGHELAGQPGLDKRCAVTLREPGLTQARGGSTRGSPRRQRARYIATGSLPDGSFSLVSTDVRHLLALQVPTREIPSHDLSTLRRDPVTLDDIVVRHKT